MKEFAKFEAKAAADVGYEWQANIRLYVTDDTWLDISETLLMPEDRTGMGEPPNDWAVRCFLREQGPYRGYAKKLCEAYYTNALTPFKMVTWPTGSGLDHVSAVYEYFKRFRKVMDDTPKTILPDEEALAEVVLDAIQPHRLQAIVRDRAVNGLPPQMVGSCVCRVNT